MVVDAAVVEGVATAEEEAFARARMAHLRQEVGRSHEEEISFDQC